MDPTDPTITLADLRRCSLAELEAVFAADRTIDIPYGRFRGIHLQRLDNPGARDPVMRSIGFVGFEAPPFGIDFDTQRWFFFHPGLQIGRFRALIGQSRWRDTQSVSLHYDVSRLPQLVRGVLYDEVKPLTETLCLGLGGINADRDRGDHFFFALERI